MYNSLRMDGVCFMKNAIINYELGLIKRYKPAYTDGKLAEIKYGLEVMYLNVTKSLFIFLLALYLGIFKEMLIMLISFNLLRRHGFGLHATKSWICLLSSTLTFIFFPILAKVITINLNIKCILGILAIILTYKYAPADTSKRPLIYKTHRDYHKFISTVVCIILVFLTIAINNNIVSNLILLGIYCEVILILPTTYSFFNLSYNNYENYIISNH